MAAKILRDNKRAEVEIAQAEAPKLREVVWYKDAGLRRLYTFTGIIMLASATQGFDGSMLNGLQILPVWQEYFHSPRGSLLGLFGCIFSVGGLIALPLAPWISDTFGRKVTIMVGCVILFIGVAVQGASQNFQMFIAARFFVGFGCAITQNSAPLLLAELCHPQHRGRVTAVYNTIWHVGSITATWSTFGTFTIKNNWSWRIPSILQGFPSMILFCLLWMIPESPRWLIYKDRHEEALNILAKYHANGDRTDATVLFEYTEIKETIHLETVSKKSSSYLDFLKTRGNRYRLLLIATSGLFSQWSGNGLTSYYFSIVMDSIGITDTNTQFEINGGLAIVSMITAVSFAFLVDKFGRRPLFIAATAGMLIVFALWTMCSALFEVDGNQTAGKVVVFLISLHGISYNLAWSGLLIAYTVEITPFKMRAKGLMLMNFFVQVALIFNQYVNPIGLAKLYPHWHYYIIYCIWIFIELCVVIRYYVETKGVTLEEVAKIFDGDEAQVGHVDIDVIAEKLETGHFNDVLGQNTADKRIQADHVEEVNADKI